MAWATWSHLRMGFKDEEIGEEAIKMGLLCPFLPQQQSLLVTAQQSRKVKWSRDYKNNRPRVTGAVLQTPLSLIN